MATAALPRWPRRLRSSRRRADTWAGWTRDRRSPPCPARRRSSPARTCTSPQGWLTLKEMVNTSPKLSYSLTRLCRAMTMAGSLVLDLGVVHHAAVLEQLEELAQGWACAGRTNSGCSRSGIRPRSGCWRPARPFSPSLTKGMARISFRERDVEVFDVLGAAKEAGEGFIVVDDDLAVGSEVDGRSRWSPRRRCRRRWRRRVVFSTYSLGHAAMADDQRGTQAAWARPSAKEAQFVDGGLIVVHQHAVCAVGVLRKQRRLGGGGGHPHGWEQRPCRYCTFSSVAICSGIRQTLAWPAVGGGDDLIERVLVRPGEAAEVD